MKKGFILFIVFAVVLSINAQNRRQKERTPEEVATNLTEELNRVVALDSIQYQAIFIMNLSDVMDSWDEMNANRERVAAARKEGRRIERPRLTEEQRKARMDERRKRKEIRDGKIKEILSSEQYEKYLKSEEEKAQKRKDRPHRRNRG